MTDLKELIEEMTDLGEPKKPFSETFRAAMATDAIAMTATAPVAVEAGLVERQLTEWANAHFGVSGPDRALLRRAVSSLASLQSQIEALTQQVYLARNERDNAVDGRNEADTRATAAEAEVTRLRQRAEVLDQTVDFVTRWCWRQGMSDRDRLEAIKWHPVILARTKETSNV